MHKLIVVILLSWINISWAANYYVDKNATGGNNNGTSWESAWTSFDYINWTQIQPGDIIYISGGTDSTTYYEQLTIGTSGITVTKGISVGHNGKVIIDGQNTRQYCINADSRNNITIDGENNFLCKNATQHNLHFRLGDNLIVKDIDVYISGCSAGIWVQGTGSGGFIYNVLVDNVSVSSAAITTGSQMDAGYFQDISGLIIRNSSFTTKNSHDTPHSDALQLNGSEDVLIENNFFHNEGTATTNKQGLYTQTVGGYIKIRNNYILMEQNAFGSALSWENWLSQTGIDTIEIVNNVVVSLNARANAFRLSNEFNVDVSGTKTILKNNIIYTTTGAIWIDRDYFDSVNDCDYNIFYKTGGTQIYDGNGTGGTNVSWATWQGYGYDAHSYTTDPDLTDGVPNVGSDAIDNGTTISDFNYDKIGTVRPQGSFWDIGAYEYTSRGPDLTPPEVIGAVLLDSITLRINFSETLEQTSAEDENNYSITNSIDVITASLSGSEVTLTTSEHSPGIYTVTVNNVTDLAGNLISSFANSAQYELSGNIIQLPIQEAFANAWYLNYTPELAIDGQTLQQNPGSRWGGAIPLPDSIIFDLGQIRTITKTRFSFFEFNNGRIYEYCIKISNDMSNWQMILPSVYSSNEEWSVEEFGPVSGRYILLISLSNNQSVWAGLWEAEIWGYENVTTTENGHNYPSDYELSQNYPNPFNPTTRINYYLPEMSFVSIVVYDLLGNEIGTLVKEEKPAGSYEVEFNARGLTSGIYFYNIQAGSFIETKKMILLK